MFIGSGRLLNRFDSLSDTFQKAELFPTFVSMLSLHIINHFYKCYYIVSIRRQCVHHLSKVVER